MRPRDARRDRGFTLPELLIVITIMGTLVAAIASAAIVALRTTPSTQERIYDARTVQGLVTWLPQDVDAAPPDGFNRDPDNWPCAAPAPANSFNVLSINWTESSNSTTNFAASYRYEGSGTSWTMARYYCVAGGTALRNNLTSEIPLPWDASALADPLAQPARTFMCKVVVDHTYDGNCPAGQSHTADIVAQPLLDPVLSLKLELDLGEGHKVMIDAAPKNPDQTLADDPDATANQRPTTQNVVIDLAVEQNTTTVIDLAPYFGAVNDPDGEETALTVSVDPTEVLPSNVVSATTAYTATTQFELTVVAGAAAAYTGQPLVLIVSDERGGWTVVQARVTVFDPPNVGPTVPTDHISIGLPANPGVTATLDTATLFAVVDDAPLSELVSSITQVDAVAPADLAEVTVDPVGSSANVHVRFGSNIALSVGGFYDVYLELTDAEGAVLPLQVTIEVLPSTTNVAPAASPSSYPVTIEAGANTPVDLVTNLGVSDANPGDVLTAAVQSAPTGVTATVSGMVVTVTAAASAPVGPSATPVTIRVTDLHGLYVDVTIPVTVTTPPPPPSNCVLGSLTATPNPVLRQGGGTGPKKLQTNVIVTLTYSGTCDGLRLNYDSGDSSGLGTGPGRVFPPGSPTSIVIVGNGTGGTEAFTPGAHVLTASTSSAVAVTSVTTTLTVT